MPPNTNVSVLRPDGSLTPAAISVLHLVSGVGLHLLQAVRIRPSTANWLRAPWYSYHRGGAITIGRTIWFTRKWFAADGHGDGSLESTRRWLLHLAHEVGHLPQAERSGQGVWGKLRYVSAFACQYTLRAITLARPVHDGSPLEMEADRGRQVLLQLLELPQGNELLALVHRNEEEATQLACSTIKDQWPGLLPDLA